jgi:hypothetical protein
VPGRVEVVVVVVDVEVVVAREVVDDVEEEVVVDVVVVEEDVDVVVVSSVTQQHNKRTTANMIHTIFCMIRLSYYGKKRRLTGRRPSPVHTAYGCCSSSRSCLTH